MKHNFELVWFARNRSRYPTHPDSKCIENSKFHREELAKLRTNDCDFHHGFNSGVLATSRLFKQISDVSHAFNEDVQMEANEDNLVLQHTEKVKKMKRNFPDLSVDSFPSQV